MHKSGQSRACLIEAIGGPDALDRLVGAMYFHVLNDARIAHFFAGAPIERILLHQKSFFFAALTGVHDYTGRDLAEAHADLIKHHGLAPEHLDIVMGHLRNSLLELGVGSDVTDRIVKRVRTGESLIFGVK